MAIKSQNKTQADDGTDTLVTSPAYPNYYDTQVMFAGHPGGVTAKGAVRRNGRPPDPVLDDLDDTDDMSDLSDIAGINGLNNKD